MLFCQSYLGVEQRAPVRSQNRGADERGNQLYHEISRSKRAGEEKGHWKVTMAGGMVWDELQRARH